MNMVITYEILNILAMGSALYGWVQWLGLESNAKQDSTTNVHDTSRFL